MQDGAHETGDGILDGCCCDHEHGLVLVRGRAHGGHVDVLLDVGYGIDEERDLLLEQLEGVVDVELAVAEAGGGLQIGVEEELGRGEEHEAAV